MTWTIDKSKTKLGFSIKHMLVSTVRGHFSEYECELKLDPDSLSKSSVRATVQGKSIDTRDARRDHFMSTSGFFGPSENTDIIFESTGVKLQGSRITLDGQLTIRGTTNGIQLKGSVKGPKKSFGDSQRRLSFSLKGELDREAYHLDFVVPIDVGGVLVGKTLKLILDIELLEN